ncbi:MAG: hypothetical protein ACI8T1_000902 [Verrucomicrobiales bacterium]|jgi:hypothetical protein
MKFRDRNWRQLLTEIKDRQVVPILGPELLVSDSDTGPSTFSRYLAQQLVDRLELDTGELSDDYDFGDVVTEFLSEIRKNPNDLNRDDLYFEIRDLITNCSWPVPKPLKQLAAIGHFDFYISTTVDSFMENALNQVRFGGSPQTHTIAYALKSQVADLPDEMLNEGGTTLFQFFGKVNPLHDFAVTDEDILAYAHRLQARDLRPYNIFDKLRSKHLLTLGCSFPGWLTRFFLAATKGEQLFAEGVRGLVVDDLSPKDRELVMFLEGRKINVYTEHNAVDFIDELHRRWTDEYGHEPIEQPRQQSFPAQDTILSVPTVIEDQASGPPSPEAIFISYHSSDREVARTIAKSFEAAGVDVWFDREVLLAGDDYRQKIEEGIEKCSFFVPIISQHSIVKERRFLYLEWNKAIDEAKFRPQGESFLLPIFIDETSPVDEAIPREFKQHHCNWLKDLPALVDLTKQRIRERRRNERVA